MTNEELKILQENLLNENYDAITPQSRIEGQLLDIIKGETPSISQSSPQSRVEAYMQCVDVNTESGGGVGIMLSEFGDDNLPRVADARSVPVVSVYHTYRLFSAGYGAGVYSKLKKVYLPDNLTYISDETFSNCYELEEIIGDLSTITTISTNAFSNCKALKDLPYLPNLITTNYGSFLSCTSLTNVKIYNKLKNFHGNTFPNCTNITDIYVPWSEGEVANAPWGATNATIHYNTVYDENHNPIV